MRKTTPPNVLLDDCFLHDKDRLKHEEAIAILQDRLLPIVGFEPCSLDSCAGRITAQDIASPRPVPGYDNSAVDGYAYCFDDFEKTKGDFAVSNRIAAGDINPPPLVGETAVRIFTGAPIPKGADTVAMQEDCSDGDGGEPLVHIPPGLKAGANLRKAGEDLATGDQIAMNGDRLRAQDVAALASVGLTSVMVHKPLRVALISNGNEIRRPGDKLEIGQVYDANHYLLGGLLQALNVEVTDLGVLPDNREIVEATLVDAAASHDIVLSSGGASRGEEDHIIATLEAIGKCHLWQLAIKPGRPMSFGQIGNTVVFGLPGNPVASFVCFLLYVRPALERLSGAKWPSPERYLVPAGFDFGKKKSDRREFWRGRLVSNEGGLFLQKFERDGSGLISGLREADGLIEVPESVTSVKRGDMLNFIPLSQFMAQ